MKYIRKRVLSGELIAGGWCNLGSSMTVEIAGRAGLDWVMIDIEHGSGDYESLVHQLQAIESTPAAPMVRIAWNEAPRFKRVLDLGPSGVMVPYISSAEEAKRAVAAMRYPPLGVRGVAKFNRASGFGDTFEKYLTEANENLLTIVQVETVTALENLDAIAAVDGVDVLFVGPLDLSVSLGVPQQFDHPKYQAALDKVVAACRRAKKAPGILVPDADRIGKVVAQGFTFVAAGSDGGMVAGGMKKVASVFQQFKKANAG